MKKILTLLLVLNISIVLGQNKAPLRRDSILTLFKSYKPFEVKEKIYKTYYSKMDFKALYSDTVLKTYFLKWLDIKEYNIYQSGKNILYKSSTTIPDPSFFLLLRYPESYTKVKEWYPSENDSQLKAELNYILVGMNDPDAEKRFDAEINSQLDNNPPDTVLYNIQNKLAGLCTIYCINKILELLDSKIEFAELKKSKPRFSFKCGILSQLESYMAINGIDMPIAIYNNYEPKKGDYVDVCNYRLKNYLPEIKALAEKLKVKIQTEQLYWMKDMPFYKGI